MSEPRPRCLVVGIGNVLMGDEGVGVHAVRRLAGESLAEGVACLDGGTGGLHLLGEIQGARRVILVDATADGGQPGSVRRLVPRFSADYPRTLTAHDLGLKDLIDALALLGEAPPIVLFAVSVDVPGELGLSLSPEVAAAVPAILGAVRAEIDAAVSADPG